MLPIKQYFLNWAVSVRILVMNCVISERLVPHLCVMIFSLWFCHRLKWNINPEIVAQVAEEAPHDLQGFELISS